MVLVHSFSGGLSLCLWRHVHMDSSLGMQSSLWDLFLSEEQQFDQIRTLPC